MSKFLPNSWVVMTDTDLPFRIKKTDASKLQDEYAKLVEGLQEAASDEDTFMSNPGQHGVPSTTAIQLSYGTALPEDLLKEAVPGNIRKADHFVAFLKRLVEYLKVGSLHPIVPRPLLFMLMSV